MMLDCMLVNYYVFLKDQDHHIFKETTGIFIYYYIIYLVRKHNQRLIPNP